MKTKIYHTSKRYISRILAAVFILGLLCQAVALEAKAAVTVETAANAGNLIAARGYHSLALNADGTVTAWGRNDYGQSSVPSGLTDVIAISGGLYHSLALKSDGTVVVWGDDTYDQRLVPSGLTDVVAIAAGGVHSLALKSDGTVVAWGYNDFGECNVPSDLTDVIAIAAGTWHSLALKSDGTVVAWGDDTYDQPSVPSGLTDVIAISGGLYDSLALKSDGTVVVWGGNYVEGTVLSGLTDVVAIAAGAEHSLALKSDGTVVAWGWGDNTSGQCNVPSGLTDVVAIAAGRYHSLALKSDGSVVAWGDNDYGQCNVPSGLNLSFTLSDLIINDGALSLGFDPEVLSYTLDLPNAVDSISLSPFADSGTIEVQGVDKASGSTTDIPINMGDNIITVNVIRGATGLERTYTLTVTRATVDNTNANLYKLETGTGVLSPAFETSTTDYTVSVDNAVSSIDITALPESTTATTTIDGQSVGAGEQTVSFSLDAGKNVITIEVRAGDNQTIKAYSITVMRGPSDNADLSALSVGTGSLDPALFDPDTVAYSVQTSDSINSIAVTAATAESGATMTIGGQTAQNNTTVTVPLDNGANLIPIVITAPDGATQKSYIISVNGTVSDAELNSLSLSAGTLNFSAATTSYYVTVGSDVTSVDIEASPSDSKAIMLLEGAILTSGVSKSVDLSVGENIFTLMVIAQDATTKSYTVIVNRGSSDATLSGLTLSDGTVSPSFNRTTYAYTASVANAVDSLTVSPTAFDNAATVTVNGADAATPVSLSVGSNTVTVLVTGADGVSTKTYTITVTRQEAITITNASLPVSIVDGFYSVTMAAEGGDGTFTWSAAGLPASNNLSIDSATGVLSGTPADGDVGRYTVTITATDGNGVTGDKSYTLVVQKGCGNGAYLIVSDGDPAYTGSYTDDGIPTLTVNDGVSGFTYFGVDISAVTGHAGKEICVFVQTRNGEQIGFSFVIGNFDALSGSGSAFNVRVGDVIEVYIVDGLTNGTSDNPTVL